MKRMTMKDFEIFRDNGHYAVVAADERGTRRNYAGVNCKTLRDARAVARDERDFQNEKLARA